MTCFIMYSNFVVLVQNHFLSIRRTQVVERDSEEVFRRCSFAKFTEKRRKRSILNKVGELQATGLVQRDSIVVVYQLV